MTEPVAKPKPPSLAESARRAVATRRDALRDDLAHAAVNAERPAHRWEVLAPPPRAPRATARKPAPPLRVVDSLSRHWRARPERLFSLGVAGTDRDPVDAAALAPFGEAGIAPRDTAPRSSYRAAVPAPRGAPAILAALNARRITLRLTADQQRLYILAPAGKLDDATVAAITASARLLVASLAGTPLFCELGEHDGPPALAISLLAGDAAAACAECLGKRS